MRQKLYKNGFLNVCKMFGVCIMDSDGEVRDLSAIMDDLDTRREIIAKKAYTHVSKLYNDLLKMGHK